VTHALGDWGNFPRAMKGCSPWLWPEEESRETAITDGREKRAANLST
jgi:hypothetical protein